MLSDPHGSCIGTLKSAHEIEQRGLAGTIGADHAGDAAGRSDHVDARDRNDAAKGNTHAFRGQASARAGDMRQSADRDPVSIPASYFRSVTRCASAPAIPPGAVQRTIRSPAPNTRRRYSARLASTSGRNTTTADPISGPRVRPGAANNHDQQKQDRLRKRKRTWRDEAGQRRLQATGKTGRRSRQHEGRRAHRYRAYSDTTRGGRRRGKGLHRETDRTTHQIIKQHQRNQAEGRTPTERCRRCRTAPEFRPARWSRRSDRATRWRRIRR